MIIADLLALLTDHAPDERVIFAGDPEGNRMWELGDEPEEMSVNYDPTYPAVVIYPSHEVTE